MFCEDLRLDPALARPNTDSDEQSTSKLTKWPGDKPMAFDPPGDLPV
jgi:hypothetical protein